MYILQFIIYEFNQLILSYFKQQKSAIFGVFCRIFCQKYVQKYHFLNVTKVKSLLAQLIIYINSCAKSDFTFVTFKKKFFEHIFVKRCGASVEHDTSKNPENRSFLL